MLIVDSLQSLFEEINQAGDEQDLRSRVIISLGEYFAAKRCGLFSSINFPKLLQILILPSWRYQ